MGACSIGLTPSSSPPQDFGSSFSSSRVSNGDNPARRKISLSFPEKSRHPYPPPPTTGTREALMEQASAAGTREVLMELRAAPYPYSKMCNVCNVCNVLTCMSKQRSVTALFVTLRCFDVFLSSFHYTLCTRASNL